MEGIIHHFDTIKHIDNTYNTTEKYLQYSIKHTDNTYNSMTLYQTQWQYSGNIKHSDNTHNIHKI